MSALYRVVGPHAVWGIEPGGVSAFDNAEPPGVQSLVASGHLEPVTEVEADADPAPAQQQALPLPESAEGDENTERGDDA